MFKYVDGGLDLVAGVEVHRRPDASGWASLSLSAAALPVAEPALEAAE
jgi:hypothetical protein